ncbi:hypothetical protein BJ742DRAFT_121461 [Cladochytrium replicatum]|nr:hypothetical protein BJ742DRAFT_121461 [Cladochytrium replicatum]
MFTFGSTSCSYTSREPYGVVCLIISFNYPVSAREKEQTKRRECIQRSFGHGTADRNEQYLEVLTYIQDAENSGLPLLIGGSRSAYEGVAATSSNQQCSWKYLIGTHSTRGSILGQVLAVMRPFDNVLRILNEADYGLNGSMESGCRHGTSYNFRS